MRVIFVECYVERLLELNLWSFWKVVSKLCRFVTGQVRSKCDLLYYSSENVLFDLCWPFLTNEKTSRFLTLDSCRGYLVLPVARVKVRFLHICVENVWKNAASFTRYIAWSQMKLGGTQFRYLLKGDRIQWGFCLLLRRRLATKLGFSFRNVWKRFALPSTESSYHEDKSK